LRTQSPEKYHFNGSGITEYVVNLEDSDLAGWTDVQLELAFNLLALKVAKIWLKSEKVLDQGLVPTNFKTAGEVVFERFEQHGLNKILIREHYLPVVVLLEEFS
jgi:hypothetical protein